MLLFLTTFIFWFPPLAVSKEFTSAEEKRMLAKYDVKLVPETESDKTAAKRGPVDNNRYFIDKLLNTRLVCHGSSV